MAERGNHSVNDLVLGKILEAQERGKQDRQEILARLADIDEQMKLLNGRTRKLEDNDAKSQLVWKQVSDMAEPIQILNSSINTVKNWLWRLLAIAVVAIIAGNQAAIKLIDLIIKLTSTASP